MRIKVKAESDLADPIVRRKIIEEIRSQENKARKDRFYRFYQCYKDNTKRYVMEMLLAQFDRDTVEEMRYAVTNMGFARKVVDKLARVYNYGVTREAFINGEVSPELTKAVQEIVEECDINRIFKKTNRWLKRDKNCVQYITPRPVSLVDPALHTIKPIVLAPYLYDAVELEENREVPACFILSDYVAESGRIYYTLGDPSVRPVRISPLVSDGRGGELAPIPTDGRDATIADAPEDQREHHCHYIFWSDSYHFTCDHYGNILGEDGKPIEDQKAPPPNPIGMMPMVNYAEDQDNSFWAQGGDDLIDGAININAIITNIIHIAITQGYGQAWWSGAKPPRSLKLGPNKVILMEQPDTETPSPQFGFATANPPLGELRQLVEFYVALLLTTNNLSTSGISTTLGSAAAFPSGIAMMIDKAESMEDIEDQRQIFKDNEPRFWEIFARWQEFVERAPDMRLTDELRKARLPINVMVRPKFTEPQAIISEGERLDVLEKKQKLGLLSRLDLLRSEYPDYTDEQLVQKLADIIEDNLKAALESRKAMAANGITSPAQQAADQESAKGDEVPSTDEDGPESTPSDDENAPVEE